LRGKVESPGDYRLLAGSGVKHASTGKEKREREQPTRLEI